MNKKMVIALALFLTAAFCFAQRRGGGSTDAWKNNWLYLGARLGGGPNFYKPASDLKDAGIDEIDGSFGFNGAAQIAVQLADVFALQTEFMVTHDEGTAKDSGYKVEASYDTLLIPLLAKLTFRPNNLSFAGFAGIYFTVPLGDMEYKASGYGYSESEDLEYKAPAGFMIGASFGVNLGPGVLFGDIRYAGDFEETTIDFSGTDLDFFTRGKLPITIGYEIGLVSKGGGSGGGRRR
jgi:hypothetical protein